MPTETEMYRMIAKDPASTNYRGAGPMRPTKADVVAHEGQEQWPERVIVRGSPSSIGGSQFVGPEVNELVGAVVVSEFPSSIRA